jgi:hypothetical protein
MEIVQFQPHPGESILYRTFIKHEWYMIAWKIGSGIVGITLLTFILFGLLDTPTESVFSTFLPIWSASLLTKILYLGLVPLAGVVWVTEDVISTYIGEFILTDQRLWVRGSPYAWSQNDTPLDDIAVITWRRDAVFIRQKSTRKLQVHIFPEGKKFVEAYKQFTGKGK